MRITRLYTTGLLPTGPLPDCILLFCYQHAHYQTEYYWSATNRSTTRLYTTALLPTCPLPVKDLTTEKQGKSTTIQDKSGKCLTEENEILNRWTVYCSDLYNYETDGDPIVLDCQLTAICSNGRPHGLNP